jgi:hypothetical protein
MRRFLFLLFAVLMLGPPGWGQSSPAAKTFTLKAANQNACVPTAGLPTVSITLSGTASLTLTPQVSVNGGTASNSSVTSTVGGSQPQATIVVTTTITAANSGYSAPVGGSDNFCLNVSSYSSGSLTVVLNPSAALNASLLGGAAPVTSVFTRTGAVVPESGDYTCAEVTGCATPSFFYNTGLAPRLAPTYLPTDNTPATIVNTTLDADGFTSMFPDGTFVEVYQSQPARGSNPTSVVMRTSTDQGGHWSTANVILAGSGSTVGYSCCGGGVTNTGRLVVSYELITGGVLSGLYTIYSDNEGATWSTPYQITNTAANMYGGMITIGNGQLLLPNFNQVAAPPYQSYVYISSDNGATWGSQITVLSDSTTQYTEASYAYLGGETILGMVRCDNCTNNETQEVLSTDNGQTWTNQGGVNFQNDSLGNSPWLATFMGPNGRRVVEWITQLRSVNEEVVLFGYATDLIAAVNSTPLILGWNENSQQVLGTFPHCQDQSGVNGYGSVVHPFDSPYGLGRYYQANSGTCATDTSTTVFFTVPPNKSVPIDERINGTVSAAANSSNWTPYFVNQGGVDYSVISVPTQDMHSIFIGEGSSSGQNVANSKHNIGIGFDAGGFNNAGGDFDIAIGFGAFDFVGTGNDDTGVGYAVGQNLSGAQSGNTYIGAYAGYFIADGSTVNAAATNETLLGYNSFPLASGDTNEIVIGANSVGAGSNTATIGNSSTTKTVLYGSVNTPIGFQIGGAAASGNYLRGNGVNFVSSAIQVGDLPNGYNFSQLAGTLSTSQVPTGGSATAFLNGAGTYTAPAGAVPSVFGRTGPVVASTNDYNFNQLAGTLGAGQVPTGGSAATFLNGAGAYVALTIPTPTGTPTYTAGTNVTSVACAASYTCTNQRGELTIVGGTATTGTIATVNFSATLSSAPGLCMVTQTGGATLFGIGHGVPSTTSFTITAGISVATATVTVDYNCLP